MRLGSVLSEAMRNIGAGTARAFLMFLAVLLTGGLMGGYELADVIGLERQAGERIQAAADVKTVVGGAVDGLACDRLVEAGPSGSGAMRVGDQITPLSTPGRSLSSYEVTPGMIALIASLEGDAAADPTGVWVSEAVASDFGLGVGSVMDTDRGRARVAGVYQWPNDGRDTRFAYAMLVPASADEGFEECWVRQWPVNDQTDGLLYSTLTVRDTDGSSTAGVTQLNKSYDARWDPAAAYGSRLTRWTPLAGLAVGMLIGVLSVRRRRLEYAGALHSGQAKADQLLGIGVETLIWAMPATIAALSLLAAAAARLVPADPAGVFLTAARTPLAVFAGVLFASLAAGLTIRENQLFRYFKHR